MVQVIQANPRQKPPSFGQQVLGGLAEGIPKAIEIYQSGKRRHEENEFLKNQYGIDLTGVNDPETRTAILSSQLQGKRAEQLQGLKGQQEQQKTYLERLNTQKSFQNIQDIYNNPDLNDEQKTFGVYRELSQNPTLAHNLLGSIQQQKKAAGQDVAGKQFSKGYKAIVGDNSDELRSVLDDPKTPLGIKQKLTDLWDSRQIRKDVAARELRTRQSLIARSYHQAITKEQNRLKNEPLKPTERTAIKELEIYS